MDEIKRRIAKLGGEGILFESDLGSLNMARLRILELMSDQKWHSRAEIINAANGQVEGLRRMRELRELESVDRIERSRGTGREFVYRLIFHSPQETRPTETQASLW